jgi:hypothetical protein
MHAVSEASVMLIRPPGAAEGRLERAALLEDLRTNRIAEVSPSHGSTGRLTVRKTREFMEGAEASGLKPLEYMLSVMRDETAASRAA